MLKIQYQIPILRIYQISKEEQDQGMSPAEPIQVITSRDHSVRDPKELPLTRKTAKR